MAAETLSVRKDGAWKEVINPWVYDTSGIARWKRIHKVHVRSGGAWKLAHKTNYDDYTLLHDNTYIDSGSLNETITVGAGIHYWEVIIIGHGGGSGGNVTTNAIRSCGGFPSPSDSTAAQFSGGKWGGDGGYATAIFEVQEGSVMNFHTAVQSGAPANQSLPPEGGAGNDVTMTTHGGAYSHSIGQSFKGGDGGAANILFRTDTGYPYKTAIAIDVIGGGGGSGGILTVATRCFSISGAVGYNLTASNTGPGADGTASIVLSEGTTAESQTTTTGGGITGATAPAYGFPANDGLDPSTYGSVQVKQYGIST